MELLLKHLSAGSINQRIVSASYCVFGVIAISVCAQITIPTSPIPFTLQNFAIAFFVLFGTKKQVLTTLGSYLILGACGLPVFANGNAGLAAFAGPTGGFLLGFIFAAFAATTLKEKLLFSSKTAELNVMAHAAKLSACALVYLGMLYACGTLWLAALIGTDIAQAATLAVAPFVLFDVAKFLVAAFCAACGYKIALKLGLK